MRTSTGYFFMPKIYDKPAFSIDQQIEFLSKQGLEINNLELAHSVLNAVSYYRFSGYLLPFKQPHKENGHREFKDGATFEQAWELYQFDRKLRLHVSDAIERIEVAFRAALVNVTSIKLNPFWYIKRDYFKLDHPYQIAMNNINDVVKSKNELFIQHYFERYSKPEYPPIWMMAEALSFGTCSKLFNNIREMPIKNEIAGHLGQHATVIESWIRTLTYTRNLCAHHSRLWNRWFVTPPVMPKHEPLRKHFYTTKNYRFHIIAYVLQSLMKKIAPESQWKEQLFNLFKEYKDYPGVPMGFQNTWEDDPFWEL